jgi:hypothetical protein
MDNNIEVLLTMRDEASPTMNAFNQTVATTKSAIGGIGAGAQAPMTGLKDTLLANKSAMRELSMGAVFLGSSMLGMGVAMQQSNNQTVKGIGNMMALVGGILTAIGSAAHFVSARTKMTSALTKMNIAQIFANALAGPGGWAKIAIGVGVAGAAVYGMTKATQAMSAKEEKSGVSVTQYIAGSVVTQRELNDNVQKGLLLKGQRSGSTGIK